MKKTTEEIQKLKEYLKSGPTKKIELTFAMGYRSTSVIDKWIERKNIPRLAKEKVLKYIEGKIQ